MEFAGGIMEVGPIGLAGFEHDVKDAREFVGRRGNGGSPAEFGAESAVVFAEFALGVVQRTSRPHAGARRPAPARSARVYSMMAARAAPFPTVKARHPAGTRQSLPAVTENRLHRGHRAAACAVPDDKNRRPRPSHRRGAATRGRGLRCAAPSPKIQSA